MAGLETHECPLSRLCDGAPGALVLPKLLRGCAQHKRVGNVWRHMELQICAHLRRSFDDVSQLHVTWPSSSRELATFNNPASFRPYRVAVGRLAPWTVVMSCCASGANGKPQDANGANGSCRQDEAAGNGTYESVQQYYGSVLKDSKSLKTGGTMLVNREYNRDACACGRRLNCWATRNMQTL